DAALVAHDLVDHLCNDTPRRGQTRACPPGRELPDFAHDGDFGVDGERRFQRNATRLRLNWVWPPVRQPRTGRSEKIKHVTRTETLPVRLPWCSPARSVSRAG